MGDIEGLENELHEAKSTMAEMDATIKRLKSRLDGDKEDRRLALTMAALTGLCTYCGNSPLNAVNAVRMADQTLAALEQPASKD